MDEHYDVVVVGAGNAAHCAAVSAREAGASVLVLEKAPPAERGGNTAFTSGSMRVAYRGAQDILELSPGLTAQDLAVSDFGTYTEEQFYADIGRVTHHRADPDLTDLLVGQSFETLRWMRDKGIRFLPIYGRQAYRVDGRFRFWGGLTLEVLGGGPGLVEAWARIADEVGVRTQYRTKATRLLTDDGRVVGVRVRCDGRSTDVAAGAVVLASGGFQANAEWRTRYLGPGWDLAKVRGSRFNTGDGIRMALEIGAMPWGHWSGAHAVGWDLNAPAFGDLRVGDGFQKHSYPFSIMVNADGKRFVDEGADLRSYTYAKYGQAVLAQPGQFAWQVFDDKVAHLLRDEYRIREVTKVTAPSLPELARRLDGVDAEQFLRTVHEYNAAVQVDVPFDPSVRDGRSAPGLEVPRSNWANTIDEPPFQAYAVTCGVTFTYGGLRITEQAQVLDSEQEPMPGLYACGELVGGLFYFNYPGGSGLTAGAVFGRIAGRAAAQQASASPTGATPASPRGDRTPPRP